MGNRGLIDCFRFAPTVALSFPTLKRVGDCRGLVQAPDGQVLYTTAQVTLVAVDREKGKILRRLPATVETALTRLAGKAF